MHRQAVHCVSAMSAEGTAKKLVKQASSSTLKQAAAAAFWPDAGVPRDAAAFAESTRLLLHLLCLFAEARPEPHRSAGAGDMACLVLPQKCPALGCTGTLS